MIKHSDLGVGDFARSRKLYALLKNGEIKLGGNQRLRIYGTLDCHSGKRMKGTNRVFFQNEAEAVAHDFRPCGHCRRDEYVQWKQRKG